MCTKKQDRKVRLGTAGELPIGVNETTEGFYRVRVFYQGKDRGIGTFQTLEAATLANEIARNMLKKSKFLQLSTEDSERNFKIAKEAALAGVPANEISKKLKQGVRITHH